MHEIAARKHNFPIWVYFRSEGAGMPISIQWDPKYSLHNASIDSEHQELFSLANDVLAIEEPQREPQRFKADVKKLFRYMEFHFRHEEELMERVRYPDRDCHAAKHAEIVALMNGLLNHCVSLPELAASLRHVLIDWLLVHVANEDAKITNSVDHFAAVGAG
jgi:hemerythrin